MHKEYILSCPFCGNNYGIPIVFMDDKIKSIIKFIYKKILRFKKLLAVYCYHCKQSGKICSNQDEAVKTWNSTKSTYKRQNARYWNDEEKKYVFYNYSFKDVKGECHV